MIFLEGVTPSLWNATDQRRKSTSVLKNRIHELRLAAGLTVEQLAELADMSPSYVSLMASGARNISVRNLEKLATALNCQPLDLLAGGTVETQDILNVWASIPADRRDLALHVLRGFANSATTQDDDDNMTNRGTKKRPTRNRK